ncbi:MAG: hypothetical protein ACREX9_22690 [Gammaproteobacteria bacterium]
MAGSAAAGAAILTGALPASAQEKTMKKTFTILHTNDMHSALGSLLRAFRSAPADPRHVQRIRRADHVAHF